MADLRTVFFIDGFNLYHSVRSAEHQTSNPSRWLNIWQMCDALTRPSLVQSTGRTILHEVHYFSAIAWYRKSKQPDSIDRHECFIEALKSTGVQVHLGKFKQVERYYPPTKSYYSAHEEKETDVSIAVTIMCMALRDQFDVAAIVSGDSDLLPAIRAVKSLTPEKRIGVVFPFDRKTRQLQNESHFTRKISAEDYSKHQFPSTVQTAGGVILSKPATW